MTRDQGQAGNASGVPLLDPTMLQQLASLGGDADGGVAFVREIVTLFREQAPAMLTELVGELRREDAKGVMLAAHRLKGCCANVGGAALAGRCLALEIEGRTGTMTTRGEGIVRELEALFAATLSALDGWVAQPRAA